MEPISNYYLGKDGFYLKSKLMQRVKIALVSTLAIFAFAFPTESIYANFRGFSDTKVVYQDYIQSVNPKLTQRESGEIATVTLKWANEFQLDEKLLLAIAKVESAFNKHAISTSGAYGIMQVIPVWHKDKILEARQKLGNPEVFNINTNIFLGARVLKDCFKGTNNTDKALLCYSGQTVGYDKKVLKEYKAIQQL